MPGTTPAVTRGLDGVVAVRTRLSHVNGLAGELIIGGDELKELAGRVSFEAAAHLLWRGALPTAAQLEALRREAAGPDRRRLTPLRPAFPPQRMATPPQHRDGREMPVRRVKGARRRSIAARTAARAGSGSARSSGPRAVRSTRKAQ